MTEESKYEMVVPEGWHRIEHLCYPMRGSKGYRSDTTEANVHVINMYDTGRYVINGEDKNGESFGDRETGYWNALDKAREWMLEYD